MLVVGILIGVGISGRGFVERRRADAPERGHRQPERAGSMRQTQTSTTFGAARRPPRTSSRVRIRSSSRTASRASESQCSCSGRSIRRSVTSSARSMTAARAWFGCGRSRCRCGSKTSRRHCSAKPRAQPGTSVTTRSATWGVISGESSLPVGRHRSGMRSSGRSWSSAAVTSAIQWMASSSSARPSRRPARAPVFWPGSTRAWKHRRTRRRG